MPRSRAREDTASTSASRRPSDSKRRRSSTAPSPRSATADAPSSRTFVKSCAERSTPPRPDVPEGTRPPRRRANFAGSGRSSAIMSKASMRTPQLMSKPTAPGLTAPPCSPASWSVASTPPMGNPYPKWWSAMAHTRPTAPGNDAAFTSCSGARSSPSSRACRSEPTMAASVTMRPCLAMPITPGPRGST